MKLTRSFVTLVSAVSQSQTPSFFMGLRYFLFSLGCAVGVNAQAAETPPTRRNSLWSIRPYFRFGASDAKNKSQAENLTHPETHPVMTNLLDISLRTPSVLDHYFGYSGDQYLFQTMLDVDSMLAHFDMMQPLFDAIRANEAILERLEIHGPAGMLNSVI